MILGRNSEKNIEMLHNKVEPRDAKKKNALSEKNIQHKDSEEVTARK